MAAMVLRLANLPAKFDHFLETGIVLGHANDVTPVLVRSLFSQQLLDVGHLVFQSRYAFFQIGGHKCLPIALDMPHTIILLGATIVAKTATPVATIGGMQGRDVELAPCVDVGNLHIPVTD